MATSKISLNEDEIVSEISISAPIERVFEAVTNPAEVARWWGQTGVYRCAEFQSDLRVGGEWRSVGIGGDGRKFEVKGEYIQIEPPRLIVQTWIASWTGEARTVVRWELESTKQGTLVRIRHSGLAAHPGLAQSYAGWPRMLGWLQALLERGETIENRAAGTR